MDFITSKQVKRHAAHLDWYESCTGEKFSTDRELTYAEMSCNVCGDSDIYIGEFETEEEAIKAAEEDLK